MRRELWRVSTRVALARQVRTPMAQSEDDPQRWRKQRRDHLREARHESHRQERESKAALRPPKAMEAKQRIYRGQLDGEVSDLPLQSEDAALPDAWVAGGGEAGGETEDIVIGAHAVRAALTAGVRQLQGSELVLREGPDDASREGRTKLFTEMRHLYDSATTAQGVEARVITCDKLEFRRLSANMMRHESTGLVSASSTLVMLRCRPLETLVLDDAVSPKLLVAVDHTSMSEEAFGGLLRTALFFGADGVVVPASLTAVSGRTAKTSMGAVEFLPVYRGWSGHFPELLQKMRDEGGWNVVGFDPAVSADEHTNVIELGDVEAALTRGTADLTPGRPTLLALQGSGEGERYGMRNSTRKACGALCNAPGFIRSAPLPINAIAGLALEGFLRPARKAMTAALGS
eukprot:TRINITY_DN47664_c0_g1_i1.p1 TRINITY_DN47664_c0_g1~~TRINITY_DN47664_c0_g1_i1.p1  ORF type:complete len:403 (+),score=103.66 TRINITY_DN47664_c0_g1_i1:64-1272(+)